jgi:magnesium and cobalt transporter
LIGLGFQTRICDPVCFASMSEQPHGGTTGRWLKRITKSMSGEPRDLAALVEELREASERDLFDGDALVMLEGVLAVADMQVRDIMVPRSQMVFVERDERPEKLVELVVESGHSRFPVIGEDRDQILGILLAKDLLRLQAAGDENFEIREYMRPAVFVPESKRLNVLLKDFRRSHNHIAMVVDEYGGVCGLVTIEDVIEQIVGEIDDEHDVEEDQDIRKERPRDYSVRALTPIADFNRYFATSFSDEEYDTIGGLLMQEFGRLPRRGETIKIEGFEFRILRADRRRIDLLRVITPTDIEPPPAEETKP